VKENGQFFTIDVNHGEPMLVTANRAILSKAVRVATNDGDQHGL
jgi:hypothetical protein